jgi:hypothetical protein
MPKVIKENNFSGLYAQNVIGVNTTATPKQIKAITGMTPGKRSVFNENFPDVQEAADNPTNIAPRTLIQNEITIFLIIVPSIFV